MFDRIFQIVSEFAHLFRVIAVCHPYERAVVLRMGRYHRTLDPGWHWVIPLRVEEVLYDTVTPRTTNLPFQTVTTADDAQVSTSAIVTWEVFDIRIFMLEAAEHQEAMLDTSLGLLARCIMTASWPELKSDAFHGVLVEGITRKAERWGIRVLDVQLSDLVKTRTFRLLSPLSSSSHLHPS